MDNLCVSLFFLFFILFTPFSPFSFSASAAVATTRGSDAYISPR